MRLIQRILVDIPRWGLLGLLVLAPWIYGSTRPEGKFFLTVGLLVTLALFLLSLMAALRRPKVNVASAILTTLLLLQGWTMVLNAKQEFDPVIFAYAPLTGAIPWLPGAVDQMTSKSQLLLVTGLIGAFWIASDMAHSRRWRTRTWWVMSVTGISLVVLGIAQRLTAAKSIFWDPSANSGPTFFSTFRYHGNAGAYMNLVLPLIAARAVLCFLRRSSHFSMAFWSIATLTTAACTFVNVSKAAMAIALLILLVMACQQLIQFPIESRNWSKSKLTVVGILFVSMLIGLIWAFGFGDSLARWGDLSSSGTARSRWLVDETIVGVALPASGWWGFGPGTFQITFPFFTQTLGDRVAGVWQNAHQDYLQVLLEWGYLGGGLWAALFLGGLGTAVTRHRREQGSWDAETKLLSSACLLSIGGILLHASVDFPLQIPSLQLYAAVLLGLLWNLPDAPARKKRISKTLLIQQKPTETPQPAPQHVLNPGG
jgi:hypothetical protein